VKNAQENRPIFSFLVHNIGNRYPIPHPRGRDKRWKHKIKMAFSLSAPGNVLIRRMERKKALGAEPPGSGSFFNYKMLAATRAPLVGRMVIASAMRAKVAGLCTAHSFTLITIQPSRRSARDTRRSLP
jgi:hypothetical protein